MQVLLKIQMPTDFFVLVTRCIVPQQQVKETYLVIIKEKRNRAPKKLNEVENSSVSLQHYGWRGSKQMGTGH